MHKATIVVTKYSTQLNESGLSPNTINRRLAAIKSLIALWLFMGICTYRRYVDNVTVHSPIGILVGWTDSLSR